MKSFATVTLLLLAASSTTAQTCGKSGYDNSGHDPSSHPAYKIDRNAITPALCSALCKSEKKKTCKSFAIGKETCHLYAVPTTHNFTPDNTRATARPTRSPYYFYDVSCAITSTSPPLHHSKPICGVKGYDRGKPGPVSIQSHGQTIEQAAAGCRAQPGCTAFALIDNFVTHRGTGAYY